MQNLALWKYIEQTPLVPPSKHDAFVAQLMEKEGWPQFRAEAAMREYRRYLYLSKIRDGQIQPGPVLESLRHLHLQHASEFWIACGVPAPEGNQVLAMQTASESHVVSAETRALYQIEFCAPAPQEFWPSPTPKPSRPKPSRGFLGLMGGGFLAFVSGIHTGYFAISAVGFFVFFGAALAYSSPDKPGIQVQGNNGLSGLLGGIFSGGGGSNES